MKNKHKYQFPSGIQNEIEKPLRRKFRKEKSGLYWLVVLGLYTLIVCTIIYFVVARIIDDQARQALLYKEAKASQYASLCERYYQDKELVGTSAEQSLIEICK